jgi:predicted Rossmann-fold nucleotide-binding protein
MESCVPVLLMGTAFWAPLCDWLRDTLLEQLQSIVPADLTIWTLTDDLDEAVQRINQGATEQAHRQLAATGHPQRNADDRLRQATRPMAGTEQ